MVVSVGCQGVGNQFAIPVIVPVTEVNGTIFCMEFAGFRNGVTRIIGHHIFVGTDHHTCIAVPVILIVTANVVINVNLSGNMTVSHISVTCTSKHTNQAAAGNVPAAPQSRNFVGIVNGNIGKGQFVGFGVIAVTADTDNTAVTGVIHTGITVYQCDIFKGGVCSICSNTAGGSKFPVGGEVFHG